MAIECELLKINEHEICMGKIINVSADGWYPDLTNYEISGFKLTKAEKLSNVLELNYKKLKIVFI